MNHSSPGSAPEIASVVSRLRNFAVWNSRQSHYDPVPLCKEAADLIERISAAAQSVPAADSELLGEIADSGTAEAFDEADFAILYREINESNTTTLQEITNVPQVFCQEIARRLRTPPQATGEPTGESVSREMVLSRIAVFRDHQPESDETWESWYFAAFDLLRMEVGKMDSATRVPPQAAPADAVIFAECAEIALEHVGATKMPSYDEACRDIAAAIQTRASNRKVMDALVPTAPQTAWQPIDTAPKDGAEVLLKVKVRAGIPGKCLVGHYMPGGHCISDHPPIDSGWYFWNGCMFDKAAEPVEWCALPRPNREGK